MLLVYHKKHKARYIKKGGEYFGEATNKRITIWKD